jgi:hypothetical protein
MIRELPMNKDRESDGGVHTYGVLDDAEDRRVTERLRVIRPKFYMSQMDILELVLSIVGIIIVVLIFKYGAPEKSDNHTKPVIEASKINQSSW